MKKFDIDIRFENLKKSLEKIKALLGWRQLQLEEARPHPIPGFTLQDPVEEELRKEYCLFLARAQEIRQLLNHKEILSLTQIETDKLQQQLVHLENQAQALRPNETFIRD